MRIQELRLPVRDPQATAAWFAQVLQVQVQGSDIHIGWSTIRLLQADAATNGAGRAVHLAFNVPDNRFDAAQQWLRTRVPLQRNERGDDYFALPGNWLSQSVYFTGPDDMVLELISRRRLPAGTGSGEFHGSEISCLSEVGLPSDDVGAVQLQAAAAFGIAPLSPASPHFAPLGDDEGLLIVVAGDRQWFPEKALLPSARGVQVTVHNTTGNGGSLHDDNHGWRVRST